jgi:hypothetical protein
VVEWGELRFMGVFSGVFWKNARFAVVFLWWDVWLAW